MTEIIRAFIATKETNKVTSEKVLCWAKRTEVKRVQKALLEATKETKESKKFDTV